MGVQARVVTYAPVRSQGLDRCDKAFTEIARMDASMSDYRSTSDVARMSPQWREVDPDLVTVLKVAAEISLATDGAFDVTAGPATHLWRRMRAENRLPTDAEIETARSLIDWRAVEVLDNRARLRRPGMSLDLGGIAKGYAAHKARVAAGGITMVALAGDISVGKPPPGQRGWRVQVQTHRVPILLDLADCSISTSGSTEQRVIIDGRSHSHLIDPRTARPTSSEVLASVIADRGEIADALATAACLIEVDRIEPLMRRFNAAAVISTPDGPVRVIDPHALLQGRLGVIAD